MDTLLKEELLDDKRAFIFDLDDVIFPKRDYLLQVFYLFANFLEYAETLPPAADLTAFFKNAYDHHGEKDIFIRAAETFGIDKKYEVNFRRLHERAKLPVKLLLYSEVKMLFEAILKKDKQLFILTAGNPLIQLNKLKHIDWNGMDERIKVYFSEELGLNGNCPFKTLLQQNYVSIADAVYIHADTTANMKELPQQLAHIAVGKLVSLAIKED